MSRTFVNVDNFARVETNRMISLLLQTTGGVGQWHHDRKTAPLDLQPVIRQNRDTLYSVAIVDISDGATLTLPDTNGRYISAMVVNQDHYINRVFHEGGEFQLTIDEFDTPYVVLAVRILIDPSNPDDVATVNALQDQIALTAASNTPFKLPAVDDASHTSTRNALIELARGIDGFAHAFGKKDQVYPVRHLLGSAAGWGGLPDAEATYLNVDPGLPVGEYKIEVGDVPVDAFWSISLYNADGYFEKNARDRYNINSITAERNADGSVTINFGVSDEEKPNYFPIMDGWNYLVRLYRPHPEVLEGSWTFPAITPA